MENNEKDSYMSAQGLSYHDICEQVEDHYRNYKDRNEWLPAKNVPDSRAPSPKFGSNVAEEKPLTHTKIITLMQSGFAKQDKPCFECGQTGHWERDCPKLTNGNWNGQQGQKSQQYGRQSNPQVNGQQTKSWKLTPPSPGQPETKDSATGCRFHWCAKCKHWTALHGTTGLTGKAPHKETDAQANICFIPNPSVWLAEFHPQLIGDSLSLS